jgi:hypothetical protein
MTSIRCCGTALSTTVLASRCGGAQNATHMTIATDTYVTGSVVAASLVQQAVESFDPVLRRLLAGQQFFVKTADGRWRPCGCQLGLPCCFAFDELVGPVQRN